LVAKVRARGGKCTVGYFKQIAYGYRRPSPELAEFMVAGDPHQQLDFAALLKARKRRQDKGPSRRGDASSARA
jgi:hypothetical protein